MVTISTHVLDAVAGGARQSVPVTVETVDGAGVATGVTDDTGRVNDFGPPIQPGAYRLRWDLSGASNFLAEVAVVVHLDEDRHYHLPLLVSPAAAVSYLGG